MKPSVDTMPPSRIRFETRDGKRVRVFVRGGGLVPDPASA
jgi:hypothetical protein